MEEGKIFTTYGYLDADLIELRKFIVENNEWHTLIRTDKHIKATGEWVGNDLHLEIKKMPSIVGEAGGVG